MRLLGVLSHITLTVLVSWTMPIVTAAEQAAREPLAAATRMVGVDGVEIRVRTMGLGTRQPGQPAVVFEGGASAPLETWDTILADVARFAPVVAYDRAGTGESSWDGLPPTPEQVGTRLRRLLSQIAVEPPYILVGHSWGGALVRYFSGQRPGEIAGVLYIDPTDITLTRSDLVALFDSFGAGAAEYDAFDRIMKTSIAGLPAPLRSEAAVISELLATDIDHRGLPPQPDVPTSVIVAGRVGVPPQGLLPFDTRAYAKAMHESQVRRLETWVRTGGTFEVATNSGHSVHVDDPGRVVAAIRNLVARARSGHSAF
jgi:pimeloyl-ACP methyl ester carboxylesterase